MARDPKRALESGIERAIADRVRIGIVYAKPGEAIREWRELSPYELADCGCVIGWDHDRQAIRQFRLSRIVRAEALTRPYRPEGGRDG